jgi:MFS family permease
MTTATTLIADYYIGANRAQFLGFQAAFMGLGGVIFLTVGGFVADISWRMPFLIYLVALVLLPFILLLPEPSRTGNSSTQLKDTPPEPSDLPWVLLVLTYGIAFVTQVVFYMIPVQLPFYLQQLSNANASQSGLAIALCTLFSSATAFGYQGIKARLSFINIYAIAFLFMGIGYEIISFAPAYGIVLVGLAVGGFGLGLLMPNLNVCLTSVIPAVSRGSSVGRIDNLFFPRSVRFTNHQSTLKSIAWLGYYLWFSRRIHAGFGCYYLWGDDAVEVTHASQKPQLPTNSGKPHPASGVGLCDCG